MDFQSFLTWSTGVAGLESVVRLCETRIAHAFSDIKPDLAASVSPVRMHRCDLVRLWCAVRGIPESRIRHTLACEGVRHALQIILPVLAQQGRTLALPTDVYPVYWKLAAQAGIQAMGLTTFPSFDLEAGLQRLAAADVSVLLLPNPLKLHGRYWTEKEVALAEVWLSGHPERRLIIDAVYTMGEPYGLLLQRLLGSHQVLLLDSLSKGWLHERTFGSAVVPETDISLFLKPFRALNPNNDKLFLARELLTKAAGLPTRVALELERRRQSGLSRLASLGIRTMPVERGYLLPVDGGAEELLAQNSVLTLPASVFGSSRTDWSMASVLSGA